jgi:hypothetical protein
MTTLQTNQTATTRSGIVRILRNQMAGILGEQSRHIGVATLAHFGNLLVRITSATVRGDVVATYRVKEVDGGFHVIKGQVDAKGKWVADGRTVYRVDTSFDVERPTCDCADARFKGRACCKHVKSLRGLGLVK